VLNVLEVLKGKAVPWSTSSTLSTSSTHRPLYFGIAVETWP